MKIHPDPHLDSCFRLLDDEDESVAVTAMAELLDHEEELGDAPGLMQEIGSPLARKRIHQLQAAITIRRRRRNFSRYLRQPPDRLPHRPDRSPSAMVRQRFPPGAGTRVARIRRGGAAQPP